MVVSRVYMVDDPEAGGMSMHVCGAGGQATGGMGKHGLEAEAVGAVGCAHMV